MLKKYFSILTEGETLSHMPHVPADEAAADALSRLEAEDGFYQTHTENHARLTEEIRRETFQNGQHPYAVIITCSDARVPPEHIFQAGIGDLFVIRNAGNVLGDFDLGSVEYAVEHLGCRLVLVMGHTHCGAVAAALGQESHGYTGTIIREIRDAIGSDRDPRRCEIRNVCASLAKLSRSEILTQLHRAGKVAFAGAIYDIETGAVHFLTETDRPVDPITI